MLFQTFCFTEMYTASFFSKEIKYKMPYAKEFRYPHPFGFYDIKTGKCSIASSVPVLKIGHLAMSRTVYINYNQ